MLYCNNCAKFHLVRSIYYIYKWAELRSQFCHFSWCQGNFIFLSEFISFVILTCSPQCNSMTFWQLLCDVLVYTVYLCQISEWFSKNHILVVYWLSNAPCSIFVSNLSLVHTCFTWSNYVSIMFFPDNWSESITSTSCYILTM